MFFPQAMLRLVCFVPNERLASSLQVLAETAAFHPGEQFLLGEAQDLEPLKQSLRARQHSQRQIAAQHLLEPLPSETLLSYRAGELGKRPLQAQGCVYDDELYLWVGTKPAADLEEQWSQTPQIQSPCPDLINALSDSQCQLLFDTEGQVGHIAHWRIIDGWIPTAKARLFSDLLCNEVFILTSAEECELPLKQVPSLFNRPKSLIGFTALMQLYGTTTYSELDPTPILAVGFTLMFGMMFADLGQGLLLFLLGLYFTRGKFPLLSPQTGLKVGWLLMPIGLSACFFGALFGSAFAHEDLIPALLFHPMDNVLLYLSSCMLIGFALICSCMGIGLFNAWRSGQLRAVLWGNFGPLGLAFYLALATVTLGHLQQWIIVRNFGLAMMFVGILCMGTHYFISMKDETWPLRLFASILESYDFVMKFIMQTISFVRIGAFTFAHIALSTALMICVAQFETQPLLAWLMLIAGNLFIALFEGLLVSIQAMRLHFFELFTKFVLGGGVAFRPLSFPREP